MITIPTTIRFVRLGLAASLLGGGLLIGSAQASAAAEITPTPVSAERSQAPGTGASERPIAPAPAAPAQQTWPQAGIVGFGWG